MGNPKPHEKAQINLRDYEKNINFAAAKGQKPDAANGNAAGLKAATQKPIRGVAQLVSAPRSGRGGRKFESSHPDFIHKKGLTH